MKKFFGPLLSSLFAGLLAAGSLGAEVALLPMPTPSLEGAEPGLVERIQRARNTLEGQLLQQQDWDPASVKSLAVAYGQLGRLYLATSQLAPATAAFTNATVLRPDVHHWHYYLGVTQQKVGALEAAIASLEMALARSPQDLATLLRLGEVLLEAGRSADAKTFLERAQAEHHPTAFAHYGLGKVAIAAEDWGTAAEHFEKTLEIDPDASAVRRLLGLAYRELGQRDQARDALAASGDRAVVLPDPLMAEIARLDTGAYLSRAVAARRAGNLEEAIALYRKAVEAEPTSASHRRGLAETLAVAGDAAAAVQELQRAIELAPDEARGYRQLGRLLLLAGRAQESLKYLEKAATLTPGDSDAQLNLGRNLAVLQRHEEALGRYDEALKLSPGNASAHALKARSLTRLGRDGDAVTELEKLVALAPANSRGRLDLAATYGRLGRFAEARRTLEEGLAGDPNNAQLMTTLAQLLAGGPDPAQRDGARAVELATALMKKDATVQNATILARALAEAGRLDEALALQRRIIADAEKAGAPAAELDKMRKTLAYYQNLATQPR